MKKAIFSVLFLLVAFGLFAQTRAENRWILGSWSGQPIGGGDKVELTLTNLGTGKYNDSGMLVMREADITFSINDNILTLFLGGNQTADFTIYRISDLRMVIRRDNFIVNLTKN